MERIISELNRDYSACVNYLTHVHYYLKLLPTYVKGGYSSALEDLYEDFEFKALCSGEWGGNVLNSNMVTLLNEFELRWREYRKQTPFGSDPVFVYFDEAWLKIVNKNLIPLIEHLETAFDEAAIEYISYKGGYTPNELPPNEEILDRANTLYKLLLEHHVISK